MKAFGLALMATVWTIALGCYRPRAQNCVVHCGEGSACPDGATCSNGRCTAEPNGTCEVMTPPPVCLACPPASRSTVRCRGNVVVSCDANGASQETICDGDTPVCLEGACAACAVGRTRCRGGALETCGVSGSWEAPANGAPPCSAPSGRVLSAGWSHVCATLASGAVVCWGDNDHGQLGLGHTDVIGAAARDLPDRLTPVPLGSVAHVVDLAAGGRHTCALLDTGQVKCWGDNGSGQLGTGDINHRGDQPGELGDALPTVDLGKGRTAISIAAGFAHSCALLDDGSVKCWGDNTRGQLGVGDTAARGDDPCEMGDDLPTVDLGGARATLVVAGSLHSCALLEDGTARCWGSNGGGQLGIGSTTHSPLARAVDFVEGAAVVPARITSLAAGHAFTCALFEGGRSRCWGEGGAGQLGNGDSARFTNPTLLDDILLGAVTVASIATGNSHACALIDGGRVKCWGLDNFGQLGLGDRENRGDEMNEMGDALPFVDLGTSDDGDPLRASAIVACGDHNCAALENGRVKCWGENAFGQLGVGDTAHRGDGAGEMGDALPEVSLPEHLAGAQAD